MKLKKEFGADDSSAAAAQQKKVASSDDDDEERKVTGQASSLQARSKDIKKVKKRT